MDFKAIKHVKHVKHTDTDYLSHLQYLQQNINPENDVPNISIYSPQNITHKQSLSDDEIFKKQHTQNISLSTNDTNDTNDSNESFNADKISPLLLRDVQSASTYSLRDVQKKKKQRSRSMIAKGSGHRRHKSILIKKNKDLESQVKIYKDKITNIQDEAEEAEEEMKREYELRLLHLETKFLREKSEKTSLQSEVEKLRQELTFRREASIGYSTATVATKSPVAAFSSNSKNQFYDTTNMPPAKPIIQSYNSNHTMVINTSNNNTPVTSNTGNTNPSFDIVDNQTYNQAYNQAYNERPRKRTASSVNSHSNSSSSSASSPSTSSSNSSSRSETTSTYASTETNYTDNADSDTESTSRNTINMERAKGKYGKRNKNSKHKSKKNQQKIPKKYVHHKNKKPKSFWDNLWGLFGPPNLMCSACSDK